MPVETVPFVEYCPRCSGRLDRERAGYDHAGDLVCARCVAVAAIETADHDGDTLRPGRGRVWPLFPAPIALVVFVGLWCMARDDGDLDVRASATWSCLWVTTGPALVLSLVPWAAHRIVSRRSPDAAKAWFVGSAVAVGILLTLEALLMGFMFALAGIQN